MEAIVGLAIFGVIVAALFLTGRFIGERPEVVIGGLIVVALAAGLYAGIEALT